MNKNFKFSEFVKVTLQGDTLDLHNDYDLSKISIDNLNRDCSILWRSNQYCGTDISEFTMIFTNVSRLLCSVNFNEEGLSLRFAGYLPDTDFGSSDHFISEEDSNHGDHMILSFENETSISILADSVAATARRTVKLRVIEP
jgi:hypothetical protein